MCKRDSWMGAHVAAGCRWGALQGWLRPRDDVRAVGLEPERDFAEAFGGEGGADGGAGGLGTVGQQEAAAARAQQLAPEGAGVARASVPALHLLVGDVLRQRLLRDPVLVQESAERVQLAALQRLIRPV